MRFSKKVYMHYVLCIFFLFLYDMVTFIVLKIERIFSHVHGGAIATVHDTVTGILTNKVVGTALTANLNTNFRRYDVVICPSYKLKRKIPDTMLS